ncbi:MAG TPA: preprotein translocase subunit YajC [Myxococcaceae bacterium]|nr:preprotein translocase subunit YajC [Myxococcaceae bacterium]
MAQAFLILAQFGGGAGSGASTILFLGLLFAIMYFVMIRPQQKQVREHRALLSGLKKGDDVVTQGGILGKIHAVTDKIVTLEVANGIRVRVLKSSIQGRTNLADEGTTAVTTTKEEK